MLNSKKGIFENEYGLTNGCAPNHNCSILICDENADCQRILNLSKSYRSSANSILQYIAATKRFDAVFRWVRPLRHNIRLRDLTIILLPYLWRKGRTHNVFVLV